jgi:hypothetical protein
VPFFRLRPHSMNPAGFGFAVALAVSAGGGWAQLTPNPNIGQLDINSDVTQSVRFDNFGLVRLLGTATLTNLADFTNGIPGTVMGSPPEQIANLAGHIVNAGSFSNWGSVRTGSELFGPPGPDDISLPIGTQGSFLNTGTVYNGGTFSNGGTLSNTGTFTNIGVLSSPPISGAFVNTGTFTNFGFVGTSVFAEAVRPLITNHGQFINAGAVNAHIDNTGVLEIRGGGTWQATTDQIDGLGTLTAGTWRVMAGNGTATLFIGADVSTLAALNAIGAQATVQLSGAGSRFDNLRYLERNAGWFGISDGRTFRIEAVDSNRLLNEGTIVIGPGGGFVIDDTKQLFNARGGLLQNDGTLGVRANTYPSSVNPLQNEGTLINNGSLTNAATFGNGRGTSPNDRGDFINNGSFQNLAGAMVRSEMFSQLTNHGTIVNNGSFTTYSMSGSGQYMQESGITRFDPTGSISGWTQAKTAILGGSFHAVGTLAGALVNEGTVSGTSLELTGPASGAGAWQGSVVFRGGFSPGNSPALVQAGHIGFGASNVLIMELAGAARGTQYDAIDASHVDLGGTLRMTLIDLEGSPFVIGAGLSFDLLRAASFSGDFATFDLAPLSGGLAWSSGFATLDDGSTAYRLAVVAVPEAGTFWMVLGGLPLLLAAMRRPWSRRDAGPRIAAA